MRVLITGANGFLGREVVARAVAAGHDVTAVLRPPRRSDTKPAFDPSVTVVHQDLRARGGWIESLATMDVVVHAAAAAGGERSRQLADTVLGTERLLEALGSVSLVRLVHISSFSVYGFREISTGASIDETSPLETEPARRDAYTEAKLVQERLVRAWCAERELPSVIVRPGAIVGPGKTWDYGAAFNIGKFAFVVAPRSSFRLISLSNCAAAIVRAIELDQEGIVTVNLVDDELPTYAEFFRRCRTAGAPSRVMVPVPWRVVHSIGRALASANAHWLDGRLRLPEILDRDRQEARWKPFAYPNEAAHRTLQWDSTQTLSETIRVIAGERGAA